MGAAKVLQAPRPQPTRHREEPGTGPRAHRDRLGSAAGGWNSDGKTRGDAYPHSRGVGAGGARGELRRGWRRTSAELRLQHTTQSLPPIPSGASDRRGSSRSTCTYLRPRGALGRRFILQVSGVDPCPSDRRSGVDPCCNCNLGPLRQKTPVSTRHVSTQHRGPRR